MTVAATTNCIDHGVGTADSYLSVNVDGRRSRKHRVICAETHNLDLWDRSWVARHTCDNKRCINPDHIVPGTYGDNITDAYTRGRPTNRKLSDNQVAMCKDYTKTAQEWATYFGVSKRTVEAARSGMYD